MSKMPLGSFFRLTLGDKIPDVGGIYVLAYMGQVLYVGKAEMSVSARLQGHCSNALFERLGAWLRRMEHDWGNVRLDVLCPPANANDTWLPTAESRLIQRFRPLFNEHLQL